MTKQLKITLVQTALEWENPKANRDRIEEIIHSIQESTNLVILPEMFTTGFTMNAAPFAETMDGKTVQWMLDLASKKNIAITGSLIIREKDNFYNRLLFVTPNGEIKTYDKKHLFTLANEQDTYTPGTEKLIVEYKGWRICPMICYDLRFPVWSRNVEGYDVLLYVANWPQIRTKAWDVLLQARAIENVAYCIGVNRVGVDGKGFEYVGHSRVFDAIGTPLFKDKNESQSLINMTLNKERLIALRKKFQFLKDSDSFRF